MHISIKLPARANESLYSSKRNEQSTAPQDHEQTIFHYAD